MAATNPVLNLGGEHVRNAARSTEAANVLMLGREEYSNDLTDWLQYEPTDPDKLARLPEHLIPRLDLG